MKLQIRNRGDWTGKLQEILKSDPSKIQRLYVEGPVGTIGKHFLAFRHIILIGTGVGVTPYSCIIDFFRRQLEQGEDLQIENVHFVWLVRDQDSLGWFGDLLQRLVDCWDVFHLNVYLTSRNANELSALGYNMLASIMESTEFEGSISENPTQFHIGRPDFAEFFDLIISQHPNAAEEVGVFFCGDPRLSEILEHLVRNKSDPDTCVFRYFPEYFT